MSTAWESLANEPILDIHPYQPGKPVEELERELGIPGAVKLASNENPYGPPAGVLEALRQALAGLNRYPDGSGYYLRQALAKKHGVSAEAIVLGNGSNELIELLARTFVGLRRITTALDAMGVPYVPSRANFLLVELPDAMRAYEALLKLGVIVRPMASFGLERALRITVGTPEENAGLVDALRLVLGKGTGRP
jgi:histidinol-phosphate/aromatic aminotransferase/cobyric acid decarboxylase-like protein